MSRTFRVCVVLLSVFFVTVDMVMESPYSRSWDSYPDKNNSSSYSPSHENKQSWEPDTYNYTSHKPRRKKPYSGYGRYPYDYFPGGYMPGYYDYGFFPFRRPPKDEYPKMDPYPDRPHNLEGASEEYPLPKCCPGDKFLSGELDDCHYETRRDSPRPFVKLPLTKPDDMTKSFPSCAAVDKLRLGAIDAFQRLSFSKTGMLLFKVHDARSNSTVQVELERNASCAEVALGSNAPFAVVLCPCKRTVCLRKCCGKSQSLVVREASVARVLPQCEDVPKNVLDSWKPRISTSSEPVSDTGKMGYAILPGTWPMQCKMGLSRAPPSWSKPKPGEDFQIFADGFAYVNNPEKRTNDFCLDDERIGNGSLVPSIVFCADPVPLPAVNVWKAVLGIVGALALVAAIATHALLPELRATPFGRALMSYACALLVLVFIAITWALWPDVSRASCILNVMWSQYFSLAATFWLNVMSYDIGIAFSSYKCALDKTGRATRRRYIHYALYSWCCPLALLVPLMGLQFMHTTGSPWRPVEWFLKCRYSNFLFPLLFLYLPLLLLLILNCAIFMWAAYRIRILKKDAEILMEDNNSNEESPYPPRKRLLLLLKLLWLMAVGETLLELISRSASAEWHWYTSTVLDMLRALIIFGLSCCKGQVLRRLRERFRERVCCTALRRGSRVGPDPDADAATAAAAAAAASSGGADATDTTQSNATEQVLSSETTVSQAAVWDANSDQATTSDAFTAEKEAVSKKLIKEDVLANEPSSQDGIVKGAPNGTVSGNERGTDSKSPPGGIEMKVLSTTSL